MGDTVTVGRKVDDAAIAALFSRPEAPREKDAYDEIKSAIPPYAHQRRGVNDAVKGVIDYGFHALFFEMGTGKTKTTIDTFMVLNARGVVRGLVVVAPKAIISTWAQEELPKHFTVPYASYAWDGKTTRKSEAGFVKALTFDGPAVFLVNVEAFQTIPEAMKDRLKRFLAERPSIMAVDESSFIKSPDAKRSKALVQAGQLARGRLILTGTEITNSPLDIYMQFRFLKHDFWGVKSFFIFRARYAQLEDQYGPGGRTFKKVVGFQRVNELMSRIAPHVSRALKRDCLDLPEQIFQVIRVELSSEQRRVYNSLKENLAAIMESGEVMTVPNKIALFTKFRQIPGGAIKIEGESAMLDPNPPKLQALVAEAQGSDEQAIVWAAFTHEIEMIVRALSEVAPTVAFHGDVPQEKREANKKAFQEGKARFIVMNPAAAAYGLNLQNAHIQYTYSRVLSPSQVWQAEARTHRSGQKETCVYKSFVAVDTVDERIETLLAAKTDIREAFQTMTIADIFEIV